ncbi:TonB family protein [Asticcacaulis solisilvae]|uniref:TonB family protein n=1 Tax=Asticcacaulis solisilvae TaxID=1217274 RepID=UPI003FD8623B
MRAFTYLCGLAAGLAMAFPVMAQDASKPEPDVAHTPQAVIASNGLAGNERLDFGISVGDALSLGAYYPRPALLARHGGTVRLTCDWDDKGAVTACKIKEETPAGEGFGDAALALARAKAHVYARKVMAAGSGIRLTLNFQAAPSPCDYADALIKDAPVKCASFVTLWAMQSFYPARAQENEVEGSGVVDCTVTGEDGHVACVAASETPVGYGFGEMSAKTMTRYLRVTARQPGTAIAGTTLRLTVTYRLS